MNYFALFLLLISSAHSAISPMDLTILSDTPKTVYFGQLGFKIHADNTDWYQVSASHIKSKTVQTEYRSLDDHDPSRLTLRSESLNRDMSLNEYIRKSSKDYRRFGFKVLDIRPLTINENKAYVLDLEKEDSTTQTRQILFKNKKNVVILTCTGQRVKFQSDLKSCNQIARNFSWVN